MKQEDFTPQVSPPKEYPSKLDTRKETINAWLEEDRKMRFKQRHTAKRTFTSVCLRSAAKHTITPTRWRSGTAKVRRRNGKTQTEDFLNSYGTPATLRLISARRIHSRPALKRPSNENRVGYILAFFCVLFCRSIRLVTINLLDFHRFSPFFYNYYLHINCAI